MKKIVFAFCLMIACSAYAENVILMIGDGMGFNHLKCAEDNLFMETLPVSGSVITKSADQDITDSSAAATAYACGKKTNNGYLSVLPNGKACKTIAEEAQEKGYFIGIVSTDIPHGATPSAFYAHTKNRRGESEILPQMKKAKEKMHIRVAVDDIEDETSEVLEKAEASKKSFFIMIEGANIDVKSHKNDLKGMQKELKDFDNSIKQVYEFAEKRGDTTVIVLADHETGGLTEKCKFTSFKHTGPDVPLYAGGYKAETFKGRLDNTKIYVKMKEILFK